MKVLISGFEPFDGLPENPSELLVKALLDTSFDFELHAVVLPVSFRSAFETLKQYIDELNPDYVVAFGVATSRNTVTPERIAINLKQAQIPDNEGVQPEGEPVADGQPDGLFASLPIAEMSRACSHLGVASEVSNSAGTYVCNQLMYQLIQYSHQHNFKCGFVHIPPLPKTVDAAQGMPIGKVTLGVIEMLKVLQSEHSPN